MAVKAALKTRQVRIRDDLGCKLSVIGWFERIDIPEFLDPLVRPEVERRFAALPPGVQQRAIDMMVESVTD